MFWTGISVESRVKKRRLTHLLGLRSLVLLPLGDLGGKLLDHSRDIRLVHGRVNLNLGEVLDHTNVEVELGLSRGTGGGAAVGALLALLTLLAASANEVVLLAVLLLENLHTLEVGVVHGTTDISTEAGALVLLLIQTQRNEVVGGVEVADQTLSGEDLVGVSKTRGLLKLLVSDLLALLALEGIALGLLLLTADSPGLILVLLVGLAGLVVVVLDFADGGPLLLLLAVELGALVPQGVEVLEGTVLLGLDGIELLLDLGVLVAKSLGLGVVEGLLEGSDLGLEVVDNLLGLLQTGEVLALLAQVGDVGQNLALIDQAEGAGVDLLLKAGNFAVEFLDILEGHARTRVVLFGNASLEGSIEGIDLLLGAGARSLESLLLLTDRRQLSAEFLLLLRGGRVLVVGLGGLDLGLDFGL